MHGVQPHNTLIIAPPAQVSASATLTKLATLKKIQALRDGLSVLPDPITEAEASEVMELYRLLGWPSPLQLPQPQPQLQLVLPLQGCDRDQKRDRAQRVLDALKVLNGCVAGDVPLPSEAAATLGLEFLEDQPFPKSSGGFVVVCVCDWQRLAGLSNRGACRRAFS